MHMQTLISGYYAPLEISIFIDDVRVCIETFNPVDPAGDDYEIINPCLCIDEIICMSPYVAAFEGALIACSSTNDVHMSFDTYSVFTNQIDSTQVGVTTFLLRQPVRYLR